MTHTSIKQKVTYNLLQKSAKYHWNIYFQTAHHSCNKKHLKRTKQSTKKRKASFLLLDKRIAHRHSWVISSQIRLQMQVDFQRNGEDSILSLHSQYDFDACCVFKCPSHLTVKWGGFQWPLVTACRIIPPSGLWRSIRRGLWRCVWLGARLIQLPTKGKHWVSQSEEA